MLNKQITIKPKVALSTVINKSLWLLFNSIWKKRQLHNCKNLITNTTC